MDGAYRARHWENDMTNTKLFTGNDLDLTKVALYWTVIVLALAFVAAVVA